MNTEVIMDICQRLRGLRAAQKNLHYTFESYADHLMTDRFSEGDNDGFNCNSFIDEIQECVSMPMGKSVDEVDIDTYPEEYSLGLAQIKSREDAFRIVADLFQEVIDTIDENSDNMNAAQANLFGNIAQAASRAKAFYDRLSGKKEDGEESTSEGLAEDDASRASESMV